ncbi:MAG TPA: hypothetical protein VGN35_07560 [Jatrophihabitantaceae bacterium]|nr:hypothetical protein [Jatrophihabitantaceae bacterium]
MPDIRDPEPDSERSVDLTKRGGTPASDRAPGSSNTDPDTAAAVPLPRTMRIALAAIVAQLALAALYAVLSWPLASQLHDAVIKSNKKLKTPKVLCDPAHPLKGCLDVDKTVHAIQRSTLIITVVIGLVIAILLPRIRKGVRSSRTIYVAVTIISAMLGFSASPLSIVALFSGGPATPRVVAVLGALASIVAIAGLFLRETQRYFDLRSPRIPNPLGSRPGVGSLFRPRPPRPADERAPGMRTNPNRGEHRPPSRAKSRNDADAIARGASLARSRAKASKSRRTDA